MNIAEIRKALYHEVPRFMIQLDHPKDQEAKHKPKHTLRIFLPGDLREFFGPARVLEIVEFRLDPYTIYIPRKTYLRIRRHLISYESGYTWDRGRIWKAIKELGVVDKANGRDYWRGGRKA